MAIVHCRQAANQHPPATAKPGQFCEKNHEIFQLAIGRKSRTKSKTGIITY